LAILIRNFYMKTEAIIKPAATPSLGKKALLNIMYAQNTLAEIFSDLLKKYDLSSGQFNVLRILRDQNGTPANMFVIQNKMIAKASNATRLVDKLLLKGLALREVCTENRRKIDISITDKGLELLHKLDPAVVAYEEKFANNLTPNELESLNLLIEKYIAKTLI